MTTKPISLGSHLFFARDGATSAAPAGTVSRTLKPNAGDAAWVSLGVVDELDVDHVVDDKEIFAPTPGKKRLYDLVRIKDEITIKAVLEEMQAEIMKLQWGMLASFGTSGQFNPLEGGNIKGWLKAQQYDQNDALVNTVDIYVHLKLDGALKYGNDIVKPSLEIRVLHSTLNTGNLA